MSTIVPFFTHLCSAPKSSTLLACSLRFSYSERNASALLTESVLNCCGSGRITRVLGSTKIAVLIVGFITTPNLRGASPSSRINFSRMRACRLARSEEHTSELQSLMRISYAVFCLKKKHSTKENNYTQQLLTNQTQTTTP